MQTFELVADFNRWNTHLLIIPSPRACKLVSISNHGGEAWHSSLPRLAHAMVHPANCQSLSPQLVGTWCHCCLPCSHHQFILPWFYIDRVHACCNSTSPINNQDSMSELDALCFAFDCSINLYFYMHIKAPILVLYSIFVGFGTYHEAWAKS